MHDRSIADALWGAGFGRALEGVLPALRDGLPRPQHLKPETRNPTPETKNPKHETRNPKPEPYFVPFRYNVQKGSLSELQRA